MLAPCPQRGGGAKGMLAPCPQNYLGGGGLPPHTPLPTPMLWLQNFILTLKAPITAASDDIHKYFFIVFLDKIRLDISCESSDGGFI